ncbi:MAG: type II and III secretion system protein [Flavobacteriaceae bacterium]|nr:type II and III secretion system protein [Flavobacteriaceae bacterium]
MKKIFLIGCLFIIQFVSAQGELSDGEKLINQYAINNPKLNEGMKVEMSETHLDDYIRTIGVEHEINVYAAPDLHQDMVTTNFYEIPVRQIFIFLVKEFDLKVSINNEVISFRKKPVEVVEPPKKKIPKVDVTYDDRKELLSINLKNDSLPRVAEAITKASKKNILLAPDVKEMKVSAYMLNSPFDEVINLMAMSNGLTATKDENGHYFLQKDTAPKNNKQNSPGGRNNKNKTKKSGAEVEVLSNGFLKVNANDANVEALIGEIAEKVNANYVFYDKLDQLTATIYANQITFDDFLKHVLNGSEFTFKKDDSFYLIGKRDKEGLRTRELIQLENRAMEQVLAKLPKNVIEKVDIKELPELNGIMVSGSKPNIDELKVYINQLDQVVPMVMIDVLIVQYQKSHEVQTGLQALLDKNNTVQTGGVLFPTTDVTLNANSVNNLIDAFNGFGLFKIGKVTKDFYLTLSALENNSVITTKSTPNIATLSGKPANFSVGQKTYYFEQNNNIVPFGNNSTITRSGVWKSVDANLSLDIEPFVSKDEHVTLTVTVKNDRFLGTSGEGAPPNIATQNFQSEIRVRNGEMVLLGGLDELNNENSGTGTPFLSRVPVLKWFFSGRRKAKSKSKLHVFIKPTVVY